MWLLVIRRQTPLAELHRDLTAVRRTCAVDRIVEVTQRRRTEPIRFQTAQRLVRSLDHFRNPHEDRLGIVRRDAARATDQQPVARDGDGGAETCIRGLRDAETLGGVAGEQHPACGFVQPAIDIHAPGIKGLARVIAGHANRKQTA